MTQVSGVQPVFQKTFARMLYPAVFAAFGEFL